MTHLRFINDSSMTSLSQNLSSLLYILGNDSSASLFHIVNYSLIFFPQFNIFINLPFLNKSSLLSLIRPYTVKYISI